MCRHALIFAAKHSAASGAGRLPGRLSPRNPVGCGLLLALLICGTSAVDAKEPASGLRKGLAGHWPLAGDTADVSGHARHAINHGSDLGAPGTADQPGGAAGFNGRDAWIEVPRAVLPDLGSGDFSVSAWIHTDARLDDVPGDILSQYDPARQTGFQLSLKTNAGVTFNQANWRHLQFGIDQGRSSPWTDCGRPGHALVAFGLLVHDGQLYAGTCEPGKDEAGHLYRYDSSGKWIDCGAPAACNAITVLATFEGRIYAGTGKYRLAGSALTESENLTLGGKVFRYEGGTQWTDCGQLPAAEAVGGMVVYQGRLYASSLYKPAGFFRYEGDATWTDCGVPDGKRVEALGVYNGFLYATSYDAGNVYRYDGKAWTDCGRLGENTQTYSFAVYEGRLYVGTWPSGRVYRFEDVNRWTDTGRLGDELEVMGMLVHNGRLMAGTLPLAEVYSLSGSGWKRDTRLDLTPDVKYRRAWTAAEYQGRLFFSTLPSGHIYSFEAGRNVSWDHALASGWQHVAAIRAADRLKLAVSGKFVPESTAPRAADYDLTTDRPLRIGVGPNDYFRGRMRDVRFYRRALTAADLAELSKPPE